MTTVRPIDRDEFPEVGFFAENLKAQRDLQEVNQAHVAEAAGVKTNYISGVEKGGVNVTITMMSRLAAAVGMPLWQLLLPPETLKKLLAGEMPELK